MINQDSSCCIRIHHDKSIPNKNNSRNFNMTKKTYAGILPATMVSLLLASGCSDNLNSLYEPVETRLSLSATPESNGYSEGTLSLAASPSSTTIRVESNTNWEVEISYPPEEDSRGWCTSSVYTGSGEGSFEISVLENLAELRKCTVTVSAVDSHGESEGIDVSASFNITQNNSNVRLSPSSVEPFAATDPKSETFSIIANDDIDWTLACTYDQTSPELSGFINILNMNADDSESLQQTENGYAGKGNASFNLSVNANNIAAERTGFVTLQSKVGNYTVEIRQLANEYTFYVSTGDSRVVPAQGGTLSFEVLSPQSGWRVTGVPSWISFSQVSGDAMASIQTVTATVTANPTDSVRPAYFYFESTAQNSGQYPKSEFNIRQTGNDFTFQTDVETDLGVIMEEGGELTVNIDSRFDWRLDLPSWVTSDKTGGTGAISNQKVTLNIARNRGDTRNGNVKVIPLPTSFAGLGQINPENMGIAAHVLRITQYGGHEPAVSVPWVTDIGQTSATVEFNYHSPFYEVAAAGLRWRRLGEGTWHTVEDLAIADRHTGYVTCRLDGLTAATEYELCGFVVYRRDGSDVTKEGAVSGTPLTTAGTRPGGGDNPTPGI